MEAMAEDERPAASAPAQGEQPSSSAAAPKPSFAPVSAFDQSGRRVEFRRVRPWRHLPTAPCTLASESVQRVGCCNRARVSLWLSALPLRTSARHFAVPASMPAVAGLRLVLSRSTQVSCNGVFERAALSCAGHSADAPHDAAEERMAVAVPASHRESEAGHAHESEGAQGAPCPLGLLWWPADLTAMAAAFPSVGKRYCCTRPAACASPWLTQNVCFIFAAFPCAACALAASHRIGG